MIKSYQKNGKTLYEVYVAERDKFKKIIARRKRGITSERQAREVEFQFKVELDTLSKSDRLWTWEKWHEECVRRMKMVLKNSTILNYEGRVKRWAPDKWKLKEIKSFTTNDILDVLENIQSSERQISPKYFLKLLRRLFQMAVEEGIIEKNPTAFIKLKETRKIQKVLNSKEAEILLQKAQETGHRFFPIWTVAVKTGMRSGEIYALKWTDIDFENDLIKVNKQWTSKDGITQTKTGDYRVVPISTDLRKFLLELKALRGQEESVLPHLRQWTNGEQAIVLKEFCKSIGITEIKFHDLRATFITNMLAQGIPLVKVMSIVGHRKMSTTDGYLRLAGVDVKGTTNSLGFSIPTENEGSVYHIAFGNK